MFPPTTIGILSNIIGAAVIGAIAGTIAGLFGTAVLSGAVSGAIAGGVIGGMFGLSPSPVNGPRLDLFSGWGYGGFAGGVAGSFLADSSWLGCFLSAGIGWILGVAVPGIFIAVVFPGDKR